MSLDGQNLLKDNAMLKDLVELLMEWAFDMSAYLHQKGLYAEFQCWQRGADLKEAIEGLEHE